VSLVRRAHKLFELMAGQGRELERKDLVMRLGMAQQTASNVLARLEAYGCIAYAYGTTRGGVFYRFVPHVKLPEDRRGKNENSRAALRRRAARPPGDRGDVPLNMREVE
jgi:hypothetical protein